MKLLSKQQILEINSLVDNFLRNEDNFNNSKVIKSTIYEIMNVLNITKKQIKVSYKKENVTLKLLNHDLPFVFIKQLLDICNFKLLLCTGLKEEFDSFKFVNEITNKIILSKIQLPKKFDIHVVNRKFPHFNNHNKNDLYSSVSNIDHIKHFLYGLNLDLCNFELRSVEECTPELWVTQY